MDLGGLRTAVGRPYPDQDIVGRELGVFYEYVEVAVVCKNPGIQ